MDQINQDAHQLTPAHLVPTIKPDLPNIMSRRLIQNAPHSNVKGILYTRGMFSVRTILYLHQL
jgi:hypothetical protein